MAIAKFADYSGGRPSGAALHNAGFHGVIRYVGVGSSLKRLTASEYKNLVANGLVVLLVCELNTHDAEGGYNAGVANAKLAAADAKALGVPDTAIIFAAADEHMTAAQVAAGVQYVRGFRDTLGHARTGAYGFAEFVDAVHSAGYATAYWKSGSKPTPTETFITFWQRNSGQVSQSVDGVTVDIDDQLLSLTAAATTEDDTLALSDKLPPVKLSDGKEYTLTIGDVLRGLAQYIGGDVAEANTTAHPEGQYTERILSIATIATDVSAVKAQTGQPVSVDLSALESAVQTSVTTAVAAGLQGLSLAVSESAVTEIANAAGTAAFTAFKTQINK